MQITETLSDGLKRELKIVHSANELDERLNSKLDELKDKVHLKGFRPGKVPRDHIKKVYGRSAMAEVCSRRPGDNGQGNVGPRRAPLLSSPYPAGRKTRAR